MYTEFQPFGIRRHQNWLVGRDLLHPVVPELQAFYATASHGIFQLFALGGTLETVNGIHIFKKERQVKNTVLFGEFFKFRQRRCRQLYVAVEQGF
ncbi:Uncharacterised protein [Vibrio cholerae]|nr:Uncharacterised protein [Vibrio cholerae]